jgi:hypothetical protein
MHADSDIATIDMALGVYIERGVGRRSGEIDAATCDLQVALVGAHFTANGIEVAEQ